MAFGKNFLQSIEKLSKKKWYLPLMSLLSALDAFILVVPNEALLIPAVLARRQHWYHTVIWISAGSALGAASFAQLISIYGESLLNYFLPGIAHSSGWERSLYLFQQYGSWGLSLVSLSPFPQHPAVAIAGLAHLSFLHVMLAVFAGRSLKYFVLSWCAVYSPHLLKKTFRQKD
jgi:membrane protein YqaA with SNARE-associated domain